MTHVDVPDEGDLDDVDVPGEGGDAPDDVDDVPVEGVTYLMMSMTYLMRGCKGCD